MSDEDRHTGSKQRQEILGRRRQTGERRLFQRLSAPLWIDHWYLHNLSSSEDRNLGCEPSQYVEVVMFKQSKHRQQDPEAGRKELGRCVGGSVSFGGR